ncbi:MAG: nitroreductase family protein [Alphaproteobacteria bacterium]|nr:nitroreductase family protein [Alphaproteobacteria bacterium]
MYLEAGLLTRRSVRQFQPNKKIPITDIDDVLKIAMYAPSGCNKQPWEFVVVDDEKQISEILKIHPHAQFLQDASAGIVICGDTEKQCGEGFWVVDCSAATQNLLLALHGKGMGGCWCAVYPDKKRMEDFAKLLKLPAHIKPLALVVAGYPSKIPQQPQDRFAKNKIHYNVW